MLIYSLNCGLRFVVFNTAVTEKLSFVYIVCTLIFCDLGIPINCDYFHVLLEVDYIYYGELYDFRSNIYLL